jgi:hypothetical protein
VIKCPRCGADAQWGAPHCPRCFAPFVAPPAAAAPHLGRPPEITLYQKRSLSPLYISLGLGALAILAVFGFLASRKKGTTPAADSQQNSPMMALSEPAKQPNGDSSGIFQVKEQAQKDPVIAIADDTPYNLRLVLQDSNGQTLTEWISSGSSKDLTIPQGSYSASIEAPDAYRTLETGGEVVVKSFHHYEADFVLTPTDGTPNSFYIGD